MNSTEFTSLFNSIHPRKISSSYYYWRFGRQDSNTRMFFAHDEQGLKGCVGLHLLNMDDFTVALVVDAMVNEQCRGGRTFAFLNTKMNKCARANDVKALFALSNEHGARAWSGDHTWRILDIVSTYTRDIHHCPKPSQIIATAYEQSLILACETNAIAMAFKATHPELIAAQRGDAYLNWRFTNPMHNYTIMQVHRKGEHKLFGYMALKVFTEPRTGQRTGDIVDILWTDDDPNALIDMLYIALDHFHGQGISKAAMWLQTNTILDSVGHYLGFAPTQQRRYFCMKILDDDYAWLGDPAHWYLTMADSEVY